MKKLNMLNKIAKYFLVSICCAEAGAKTNSKSESSKNIYAPKQAITLAYTAIPPHIFEDENGQPAGPLVDLILKHLAPEMELDIKLVSLPLPRIFKEMNNKTIDGMAFGALNPNRIKDYLYSSQMITTTKPVLLVKNNNNHNKISWDENKTLNVGYIAGGVVSPYIQSRFINFTHLFGSNTWSRNLTKLMNGKLDATYSPSAINMHYLTYKQGINEQTTIIKLPEKPLKWFSIFSKSNKNKKLRSLERYNEAMLELNGAVLYEGLLEDYLANQMSVPSTFSTSSINHLH